MYGSLLKQHWRKTVRSKYFKQGWGVKILVGFMTLYFTAMFLILGIVLPEILAKVHPEAEKLTPILAGYILYYMLSDIVMRFFLQDLSVMTIRHYLTIPVKRSKVIHYLLGTSVFNFFNLLPLFIIVPFAIRAVTAEEGSLNGALWLIGMLALVLTDHFLAIYLKRVVALKQKVFIIAGAIVGALFLGDFLGWYSLETASRVVFGQMAEQPVQLLVPIVVMVGLHILNFRFLKQNTYLDLWNEKANQKTSTAKFSFLEDKGIIGNMVANELKLILRNKRTKNVLMITLLFAFYGLIFYTQDDYKSSYTMLVFVGIFMTGIFMINYGQFLVAWESAYFDGILTRSYPMLDFYKGKFMLLAVSCVATYILTIPYIYFGWHAFWINTATFLFNLGFNSFVLIYASTYNKKRIDLSKGSAFNYQGTSAVQFIIVLPLMILPVLIFKAFDVFGAPYYGLGAIALIGLMSLAFSKYWFKGIIENFEEKKYRTAEGFRSNE